jgi:hypothetical protein
LPTRHQTAIFLAQIIKTYKISGQFQGIRKTRLGTILKFSTSTSLFIDKRTPIWQQIGF